MVTAAPVERDAVLGDRKPAIGMVDGLEVHRTSTPAGLLDVACLGVGAVLAAVGTGCLLRDARRSYDLVLSAGIGGGFAAAPIGSVVVAEAVVQADLGAETATGGFTSMAELGWGPVRFGTDGVLAAALADRLQPVCGAVLTVSTVTGTRDRAERLQAAHPDAVAEGMEGAGVGLAAARAGVAFGEIRTISNRVGPRDRDNWQIGAALAALTGAFDRLLAEPLGT